MALIFTGFPKGHEAHDAWVDAGRPPVRNLGTAKAKGLEFPYMQIVRAGSARVERMITEYCTPTIPIRQFAWDDDDLVEAYFEAHPDKIPKSLKEQARIVAETVAPDRDGRSLDAFDDIAQAQAAGHKTTVRGSGKTDRAARAERGQAYQAGRAARDARIESLRAETFAATKERHIEKGRTEGQAAMYATRTADAAVRKAEAEAQE